MVYKCGIVGIIVVGVVSMRASILAKIGSF
jgi:hypothetical protein